MEEAICAIATPRGEGGIGIVRISGEQAVVMASSLVRLHSGLPLSQVTSHMLYQADIFDGAIEDNGGTGSSSHVIDQGLVVVMRTPHSYTGEDVVEIHCHGGPVILHTLCEAFLKTGARLAHPGEFTKRAFLNGRLDLAQAEAVLETIRAKTTVGLRLAQEQLRGSLSRKVDDIRARLIHLLAHIEAAIDFSEEDLSFNQQDVLLDRISSIIHELSGLADTYHEGRMFREGAAAVIVGRPNVGKSSLMNALLKTDRSIVTPFPGTTRDILEEPLNIRGMPIRLLDTAGLHKTADLIEQEGIRRSRTAIEQADLLLAVIDGSLPFDFDEQELLQAAADTPVLLVINKSDLPGRVSSQDLTDFYQRVPIHATVRLSAKTGKGLEDLRDAIRQALLRSDFEAGDTATITSLRHRAALLKANEALKKSLESMTAQLSGEFIAVDLRGALDALGEITGATSTDDILDCVFSEFCIGK